MGGRWSSHNPQWGRQHACVSHLDCNRHSRGSAQPGGGVHVYGNQRLPPCKVLPTNDVAGHAITFTGWHSLMRLGELINLDVIVLRDYRKMIDQCSVKHRSLPRPHISFLFIKRTGFCLVGSTIILEQDTEPLKNFFFIPDMPRSCVSSLTRTLAPQPRKTPSAFLVQQSIQSHSPPMMSLVTRSGGTTALTLPALLCTKSGALIDAHPKHSVFTCARAIISLQGTITGRSVFDG